MTAIVNRGVASDPKPRWGLLSVAWSRTEPHFRPAPGFDQPPRSDVDGREIPDGFSAAAVDEVVARTKALA